MVFMIPTLDEVERIAGLEDPVIRNLQITQCYAELSRGFAERTGLRANWCTFATWASRQAGQSIRKEDLRRALERILADLAAARQPEEEIAASVIAAEVQRAGIERGPADIQAALQEAVEIRGAVDRASQAVGRGNQKVFAELGREFARFIAGFLNDGEPDPQKLERFCGSLRPGEPPEGQRHLCQAFTRYYRAFFVEDAKLRAELLFHANIEIGFHEQTRLQPEIAAALDAAFIDAVGFTRRLVTAVFPVVGWLVLLKWLIRRLLGRETAFDRAIQTLLAAARLRLRQALTETIMTIQLPPDLQVRLGQDLTAGFPEILRQLSDPELRGLLEQLDPTPDSTVGSGALDWADLPDRLHFIIDLFRCYQESAELFTAPFTPEQTAELKAGRLPPGRL
jgi:hypothetical protein